MHIRCPISGILYSVSISSIISNIPTDCTISAPHPMLSTSTQDLVSNIYPIFKEGNLNHDSLHVFGISLLSKLPLASSPSLSVSDTGVMREFWETQIPKLIPLVKRLDGRSFKNLPTIHANLSTLSHLPYWIDELHDALTYASMPISDEARRLNREGYKSSLLNEKLDLGSVPISSLTQEEKDSLILRAIRGSVLSAKESAAFPQLISDWADAETKFPATLVYMKDGKRSTVKAIWKAIITKSIKEGTGYLDLVSGEFTLDDVQELEAHLLCGLKSSSIQSKFLFEKLKEAGEIIAEFSGAGNAGNAGQLGQVKEVENPGESLPAPVEKEKATEPTEIYQTRSLSTKEQLAIKLAKLRMKK